MATIDYRTGVIRDQRQGRKAMRYSVGKKTRKELEECLKAHDVIMAILPAESRNSIEKEQMKRYVILCSQLAQSEKSKLLVSLATGSEMKPIKEDPPYVRHWLDAKDEMSLGEAIDHYVSLKAGEDEPSSPRPTPPAPKKESAAAPALAASAVSLERLIDEWAASKTAFASEGELKTIGRHKKVFMEFFGETGMRSVSDLRRDTAVKFIEWRKSKRYGLGSREISWSLLKKSVDVMKQMAKIAYAEGWIPRAGLWDDVKIKKTSRNVKSVPPLDIEEQKSLLEFWKQERDDVHDTILFFILTGIRAGEFKHLAFESKIIRVHKAATGKLKPATGKTSRSVRTLPITPTIRKLLDRGFLAEIAPSAVKNALSRRFPGMHLHRFRHTYAVNHVYAGNDINTIKHRLGHSQIGLTADTYANFDLEKYAVDIDEIKTAYKEWLNYIENEYQFSQTPS
jgi:integrase